MQAEEITLENLLLGLHNVSEPKFVGITATTLQIDNAYKIARAIKEVFPNSRVVLGGHHPTALPEEVIKTKKVDVVVKGDGEATVKEILDSKPLNEIDGAILKNKNEQKEQRLKLAKGLKKLK